MLTRPKLFFYLLCFIITTTIIITTIITAANIPVGGGFMDDLFGDSKQLFLYQHRFSTAESN